MIFPHNSKYPSLNLLQLLSNAVVSSSSSSSSSNVNYNASLTTSAAAAAVANNNNNNNIHSFVTSITEGEDNNMNHQNNTHNNTASISQHNFSNGEVGGVITIPPTTTTTALTANDLTNLSNLQVAAAWNQQHTSQHQQNLTTLHVVGQSGTGGMSSSHM